MTPLAFKKLTPVTLLVALAWSLVRRVAYWKLDQHVPLWAVRRLEHLDASREFTLDDWQNLQTAARDTYEPNPMLRGCAAQRAAIDYEEERLFGCLAYATQRRRHIEWTEYSSRWADKLWNLILLLGEYVRQNLTLYNRNSGTIRRPVTHLWTGISASEIPDSDNQLNFAARVVDGTYDSQDVLYVLPVTPNPAQRTYLNWYRIQWTVQNPAAVLPRKHKIRIHYLLLRSLLRHRDRDSLPSIPWRRTAIALRSLQYHTSYSVSWPEAAEIEALQALGVLTINHSYGVNVFRYSTVNPQFEDLSLSRSVLMADYDVWDRTVRKMLRARNLNGEDRAIEAEPIMNGDIRHMRKYPHQARPSYVRGTYHIAVFDVPTPSAYFEQYAGLGPNMYPLKMNEAFYEHLIKLADEFPSIRFLFKPKRSLKDPTRRYPASLTRFLAHPSLVKLFNVNVDPYIPITMADMCVGLPFTSPVYVAQHHNRAGLWHDPLNHARYFRPTQFGDHLTHSYEELKARVDAGIQRGS